jgi:chromosome segregation ATPase
VPDGWVSQRGTGCFARLPAPNEVSEETPMLAFRRRGSAAHAVPPAIAAAGEAAAPGVPEAVTRPAPAELHAMVACVCDSAGAATNVGWTIHDLREVADSTSTIVSSVEALANTISELSSSSAATSTEAEAVRSETADCETEMRGARESMHLLKDRVIDMNERLSGLEGAVRQIADMAQTIEAISKQTNLLALNATIEAARAGEAGRGFAVVAGEVKSLSGQTAQATEQIRARIATLTSGMNEIKSAIVESGERVVASEGTVSAAEQRITAIGERMGGITGRMQSLTGLLSHQRTATNDISKSGGKIADKAKKVRNEIKGSIERILKSESSAGQAIDAFESREIADYELVRLKGDLAVWVRKLAATLVVLVKPDPKLPDEGLARLTRWCDAADNSLKRKPEFMALRAAEAKARAEARRFMEAMQSSKWDIATEAYMAVEKLAQEISTKADLLAEG